MPDDTWLLQFELKTPSRGKEPQPRARDARRERQRRTAGRAARGVEALRAGGPRSPTTKIQPGPGEIFDLGAQLKPLPPPRDRSNWWTPGRRRRGRDAVGGHGSSRSGGACPRAPPRRRARPRRHPGRGRGGPGAGRATGRRRAGSPRRRSRAKAAAADAAPSPSAGRHRRRRRAASAARTGRGAAPRRSRPRPRRRSPRRAAPGRAAALRRCASQRRRSRTR